MSVRTRDFIRKLYQSGLPLVGVSEIYGGYRREIIKQFGGDLVYRRESLSGFAGPGDYEYTDHIQDFGYGRIQGIRMEGRLRSVVGGRGKLIVYTEED